LFCLLLLLHSQPEFWPTGLGGCTSKSVMLLLLQLLLLLLLSAVQVVVEANWRLPPALLR
jgi:hypothetical protein